MLRTRGRDIVREDGSKIVWRGFNLGNLALIEPNMFGTPGTEHRLRRAMRLYAGEEKAERFFRGLNDKWVTEADMAYLKGLGCNSVRLPLNYRYFEDDSVPFVYKEEGFALVDRIIEYCRKYEMYCIIDLHAVQGFQSGDWPCDNVFTEAVTLYYDASHQERFCALWKAIADRYKEETWVGGYDLVNEPYATDPYELKTLNQIYRNVVSAIRSVDKNHILIVEGNVWARDLDTLELPFDENTVYTAHHYCDAAITPWEYPGTTKGVTYDIEAIRSVIDLYDHYPRVNNAPCWIGEFGVRRLGNLEGKNQALKDYITVFEEKGHSWCYWNFKDLRLRGPLYLDENSPWCKFQEKIQPLKDKYHTDRSMLLNDAWDLSSIFDVYQEGDFVNGLEEVRELVIRNIRETLGDQLTLTFAKQFAELTLEEIDELTDSFLFENCRIYEPWAEILKEAMKLNRESEVQYA